jgi:hypothetical protein
VRTVMRFNQLVEAKSQEDSLLISNAAQVGAQFLTTIREARLDAAYAETSTAFRDRMDWADFKTFVAGTPALRKPLSSAGWSARIGGCRFETGLWHDAVARDSSTMVYKYHADAVPSGAHAAVELVLVVEGSSVKIDQCTIAEGDRAKP